MLGYAVVSSLLRGDFAPIKHSVYVGLFVLSGGWIATANKLAAIRDKVFYFILFYLELCLLLLFL